MHIPRKLIKSDRRKIIDILDKFQFFQGQRAGRELWLNKPVEVQEEDLENFNKDIRTIRDYICDLETSVKKYKDLEEQGLLLKLPCKVGDTLYRPLRDLDDVIRVKEIIVIVVSVYLETDKELNAYIVGHIAGTNIGQSADFSEFGKNIFLTKEEAEAKLKELQNKQ